METEPTMPDQRPPRRWITLSARPARPLYRVLAAIIALVNAATAVYLATNQGMEALILLLFPAFMFGAIALTVRLPSARSAEERGPPANDCDA